MQEYEKDIFSKLKNKILNIDPIKFCENNLTIDGANFNFSERGYKPFIDIYRYIGIKSLEDNSKPAVLVKGRQVGGTTMALALEMYFMGCGLFGVDGKPPIRIIHAFPSLEQAGRYTKGKMDPMIKDSVKIGLDNKQRPLSYMESLLDKNQVGDSLKFKRFINGNHIWIESTGIDADRIRGLTADILFFDECFPYYQYITTEGGKIPIGRLYDLYTRNKKLPKVLTFNEATKEFEYKNIKKAWKRNKRELVELICENVKTKCTPNHRFLTLNGWKEARDIFQGERIMSLNNISDNLENKLLTVKSISYKGEFDYVYDIEVEDNHNFIISSDKNKNIGLIAHNCQDTPTAAITNATKILKSSNYGTPTKGVQIYFGTPKRKGSDYYKMWLNSNQQYYHLGCESCKKYFPLYTPESDDWENVWVEGKIVKCTHCNHKQNKLEATERGKWIESRPLSECMYVGFHINMLFDPRANKENIISEKPENNPMTTERGYRNEVLGEFFQGDSSPITVEEIIDICGDQDRRFSQFIDSSEDTFTFLGLDYGAKSDLEQQSDPDKKGSGKSYSTAVVISVKYSGMVSIEFAMKFKKNDTTYKKEIIDELMRNYSINLAVGDIGFSNDFSSDLVKIHGDRYLVSRAMPSVKNVFRAEFRENLYPNEIQFDRDFYIGEIFDKMRSGKIRFPISNKDYEKISWLIQHCASMEIKPKLSRVGEHSIHYVKSSIPNDGLMALINAYIAYKFYVTKKFTNKNIITGNNIAINNSNKVPLILGYCPRY